MTITEYRRMTLAQLKGRRVRLRREIRNGWGILPVGTVLFIEGKHNGLSLVAERCRTCGVRMSIGRVGPGDVELLDCESGSKSASRAGRATPQKVKG